MKMYENTSQDFRLLTDPFIFSLFHSLDKVGIYGIQLKIFIIFVTLLHKFYKGNKYLIMSSFNLLIIYCKSAGQKLDNKISRHIIMRGSHPWEEEREMMKRKSYQTSRWSQPGLPCSKIGRLWHMFVQSCSISANSLTRRLLLIREIYQAWYRRAEWNNSLHYFSKDTVIICIHQDSAVLSCRYRIDGGIKKYR